MIVKEVDAFGKNWKARGETLVYPVEGVVLK